MDLFSIFSGSDNLFKHLFIGGLGLIALSLFYPLEKTYELELKKDAYLKEVRLITLEQTKLKNRTIELKETAEKYKNDLSSLPNNRKTEKIRASIISDLTKRLDQSKTDQEALDIKDAERMYNDDMIKTLEGHISQYKSYTCLFLWFGILFTVVGIGGWFWLHTKKSASPSQSSSSTP